MKISIEINKRSRVPKYRQIMDSIINEISLGHLKIGERIPSINQLSEYCDLSRDTVEKAYKKLRERKIIVSVKGKGYYTSKTDLISKVNVFFLVNKLSSYKLRIYNSFVNNMGVSGHTNLAIYHCDESLFLNLMEKHIGAYDYYIIMPHFKANNLGHVSSTNKVVRAIDQIPYDKLIIMDNRLVRNGDYTEIYQDFENDIYNALKEGLDKIQKYKRLILVYPEKAVYPYPIRIKHGFRKFCTEHTIDFELIDHVYEDIVLKEGDVFITIEESDLVSLVKQIRDMDMTLGEDIGVISYNDTPLKDLLGITVISTDFKEMGEAAAKMILNKEHQKVKNNFNFIERKSL